MMETTIIIAGDLGPTPSNYSFFSSGKIGELIDNRLMNQILSADYRVFNLEVPLTDNGAPIPKDGPNLKAPLTSITGIKQLNPSVVTLANNHIFDYGEEGLIDTLNLLSEYEIRFVGAGMDLSEACKPVFLEGEGHKIGIYASAEHEFSIAKDNRPGANPLEFLESFDHISDLKSDSDYVIILHHGGKEHYRYPSPELQKVCKKMVDQGADLVICQHSHCIGSYEKYKDGVIIYGQGNFLFDRHNNDFWSTGLLIKATFSEKMALEFLPISKRGKGVELAVPEQGEVIMEEFFKRSEQIIAPGFVEDQFEKYCMENGQYYLATLAGMGKTVRRTDKVLNRLFTRLIYSRNKLDIVRNHFECETHRELILKYLELLTRKKQK